ncbi:MAG: class I SAM-dependent methyltransferase [Clostridia bacterium]|nr:class I SAM-dependent methyltransferase [Clostridia bacterium]
MMETERLQLRSARWIARFAMEHTLADGMTAVDCTMGNGHDTLLLAELVGPHGHVDAFDVQEEAIVSTEARLVREGVAERVSLHLAGHERISEFVQGPVNMIVFNLGWLPGGDKSRTTMWETTRFAVTSGLELLAPMGMMSVCAYPGHAEGEKERRGLAALFSSLPPRRFNVIRHSFINAVDAPECFLIQRQMD